MGAGFRDPAPVLLQDRGNYLRMRTAMIFALAAVSLLALGCNSQRLNEVTGKVTVDGKPVAGLEVRFEPKDPSIGTTAIGYTQADGSYKLHYPGDNTGAPAGEYSVSISGGEGGIDGAPSVRVAPKYASGTELPATVKPGPNTIDFEVTSN